MKFSSFILLSVAAVQTAAQEIVSFGVYKDAACTTPYRAGVTAAQMEAQAASGNHGMKVTDCDVMSYTSPMTGQLRTNANGRFNCEADHVTFTHWPNSNVCGGSGKVLLHTLYTNKCVPVQTHMGVTYQKLLGYTPCSAKYPYTPQQMAEAATGGVNQAGAHASSGKMGSFGGFQGGASMKQNNLFGSSRGGVQPHTHSAQFPKGGRRKKKGGFNQFGTPLQQPMPGQYGRQSMFGQQQQMMAGRYGQQSTMMRQMPPQYGQQLMMGQMPQQYPRYGQQPQQQYSPFSRFLQQPFSPYQPAAPSPLNVGFSGFGSQQAFGQPQFGQQPAQFGRQQRFGQGFGQQGGFGQQQGFGGFGIMGRLG